MDENRIRILGFDSKALVPPGETCEVITRPQLVFKGKRIHVDYEIARFFDIVDIRVGYNSQFLSTESIPADVFSLSIGDDIERSGQDFDFDKAQVAQDIKIIVTNKSSYGVRFKAAIIGDEYY